jgi:hypothetical protein
MLALANPRPTITLSRGTLPIGGSVPFEWQLTGAASRVTRLTVTLKGREERATAAGPTRTRHARVPHARARRGHDAMSIERGSGTIRIPAGTMHSFASNNNKIVWTLTVKGDINRWPDVDESFGVTVSPA